MEASKKVAKHQASLLATLALLAFALEVVAAAQANDTRASARRELGGEAAAAATGDARAGPPLKPEGAAAAQEDIGQILPKGTSLFQKDSVDADALGQMDCHLRNVDYCYAGLAGSAMRVLPESDAELEVRCDEMRSAASCVMLYNKRCQTFKVFSALMPFANFEARQQGGALAPEVVEAPLPEVAASALMGRPLPDFRSPSNQSSLSGSSSSSSGSSKEEVSLKAADLLALCEPRAKGEKANRALRQRLFQLARCINVRLPQLRPCMQDLKTALQLFYEPSRSLPLKPSCCALARFRHCATQALDDICGLSSFDQLEQSFNSGPASMIKTVDRICKQSSAQFNSTFCLEVLPPSGMRTPPKRGSRASKLAKALDLMSFAPAISPESSPS